MDTWYVSYLTHWIPDIPVPRPYRNSTGTLGIAVEGISLPEVCFGERTELTVPAVLKTYRIRSSVGYRF